MDVCRRSPRRCGHTRHSRSGARCRRIRRPSRVVPVPRATTIEVGRRKSVPRVTARPNPRPDHEQRTQQNQRSRLCLRSLSHGLCFTVLWLHGPELAHERGLSEQCPGGKSRPEHRGDDAVSRCASATTGAPVTLAVRRSETQREFPAATSSVRRVGDGQLVTTP